MVQMFNVSTAGRNNAFVKEDNVIELVAVEIKAYYFPCGKDVNPDNILVECRFPDGSVKRVDILDVFESEKKYEKGEHLVCNINREVYIDGTCAREYTNTCYGMYSYYVFKDNRSWPVTKVARYIYWDEESCEGDILDENFKPCERGYESPEEAFDHNEYDIIDSDGSKRHIVGKYKAIQFDEKQMDLINKIGQLMDEAHSIGVDFTTWCYDGKLYAYKGEIVDFSFDTPDECDEDRDAIERNVLTKVPTSTWIDELGDDHFCWYFRNKKN